MSGQQVFGWCFLILGSVSFAAHVALFFGAELPGVFRKLEPSRKLMGRRVGTLSHFVRYAVTPIAFGIALLTGFKL